MASQELGCGYCGTPAIMASRRHGRINYCSTRCLETAEYMCEELHAKLAQLPSRPGQDVYRAILLPAQEGRPQFIWLSAQEICEAFRGHFKSAARSVQLVSSSHGTQRSHRINLAYNDNSYCDDSPSNQCIYKVSSERSGQVVRDNLLLFGTAAASQSLNCCDLNAEDLAIALDKVVNFFNRNQGDGPPPEMSVIKAVKVNMFKESFEEVNVPREHPAFVKGQVSEISVRIGTPLLVYRTATCPQSTVMPGGSDSANVAGYLRVVLRGSLLLGSSSNVGAVPHAWMDNAQSVITVRSDHAPLSRSTIATICEYARMMQQSIVETKFEPRATKDTFDLLKEYIVDGLIEAGGL